MRPLTHLHLCRFLERKTGSDLLDKAWYRKIEMPRETGKSTLSRAYVIQKICANRDVAILLINEKEQLAKDFLSDIKFQLENNALLRALFPEIIPPDLNQTTWSATRIIVNRTTGRPDPTVDVIGVGGAVAGKHPDLIIADDMISREAMENARAGSWQIMHQTNRWIHQLDPLVNKSAEPCPEITFIGTRWWHNDSYEHIEDAYGYGEAPRSVVLRATDPTTGIQSVVTPYRKGDLAVFRRAAIEDGQSIFPEKWNTDALAKIRMRDPALYAANYLNQPSDEVTSTFKEAWLRPFTWLDGDKFYFTSLIAGREIRQLQDLDTIVIVDPGGFQERGVDDRARAAVVVCADDLKGNYIFLDCYSERDSYLIAIRQIVAFCQKYGPRKIYVERAGQQVAFAQLLRVELAKNGLTVPVDDTTIKPEGKAKELRILEMEPYFQRGQIVVGQGRQFSEFYQQYQQFPRAQRVDVMDVLGYWPRLMRRPANSSKSPEQRRQAELAAYRLRLEQSNRR